jgi:3-deoxy-D-manno-octulosonic-acid transferase
MRLLYIVLLYLLGPFLWVSLWFRGRGMPAYRHRRFERFGHVEPVGGGVAVWLHAVSVGEVMAALPLIRALVAKHPPGQVYVTTGTPTGSERLRVALGDQVRHSYAPYDLPHVVYRFLHRVQPQQVVVMETELWPCLYRQLRRRGIPLVIANARLSPRSMRGYARIGGFTRSVLADVSLVAAQSPEDAGRYRQLGAPRVSTLGNLKFDVEPDADQLAAGRADRARWGGVPVWVAASTHEGEDEVMLASHRRLRQRHPQAVLILVPRHPQRFDRVATLIAEQGWVLQRRSDGGPASSPPAVLLGDSMGEMWRYLAMADAAFVAGSIAPIGGHNVLEPAVLGCPVLFGPHMHNFLPARDLLRQAGGAIEVAGADALAAQLGAWFDAPEHARAVGAAAAAALAGSRGALAAHLKVLAP